MPEILPQDPARNARKRPEGTAQTGKAGRTAHRAADQAPDLPPAFRKYLSFWPIFWLLLGLIVLRAALSWAALPERMARADNDDLLRVVMVRDWLAGQSWFDMQQYRLLPPEGVSIHWSRYIDAGIGGIIMLASLFVTGPVAELVALMLWPTLLLGALLLVNGGGARHVSGPATGLAAAVGAMLCVFLWTRLAEFEFAPGRIDHHNVQILCGTILAFALAWPVGESSARQGAAAICGGLAAAFSLAVGLEMLPLILLVWAFAGLRYAFGAEGSGRWLLVFALTLGLAAPLLMAGQVPMASWAIRYCDALAPPMLSLLAVGVAVSVLPVALGPWLRGPVLRIGAMLVILVIGFWLAAPLLGPCRAGPYSAMSPEARAIIITRINEAQPALTVFMKRGASFDFLLLYAWILLPLTSFLAWRGWSGLAASARVAVGVMLLIGWLGIAASLGQIRAFTLGTPAIPFLTGFALQALIARNGAGVRRGPVLAIIAGMVLMAMPTLVTSPLREALNLGAAKNGDPQVADESAAAPEPNAVRATGLCRDALSLSELDSLPPSLLATTTNMGMSVLYFTHHSATAAPYHRSGASFWNGVDPFENEADMRKMLRDSNADYVILCRKQVFSPSGMTFAQQVQKGEGPAWLVPVDPSGKGAQSELMVFRVEKPVPEAP